MDRCNIITGLCLLLLSLSCEKEPLGGECASHLASRTIVARCVGVPDAGTKAVQNKGNTFLWAEGDVIYFYAYDSLSANQETKSTKTVSASEAGAQVELKVTYDLSKNEDRVVAIHKGSGIEGLADGYDKESVTLTGGIPAVQDGDLTKSMVSTADISLLTEREMSFSHLQSYLLFSFNSISFSDKNATSVVITDKAGTSIAGDVTYNLSTRAQTVLDNANSSTSITLNSPVVNKDYYIAIRAASYTSGLRFSFYKGSDLLGYVDTGSGCTVNPGKILDLGVLNFHKTIPGQTIEMLPVQATIVNSGTLNMTKKLWLKFTPSDVTKITWTSSNESVATVAAGPGETYNGKDYGSTAIVTPHTSSGRCTITATLEGGVSASCKIVIGEAVDMGLSVLWGKGAMKGSSTTITHTEWDQKGDYYQWANIVPVTTSSTMSGYKVATASSGGWTRGTSGTYGGKYQPSDGKSELEKVDDICYQYGHNVLNLETYRSPSDAEWTDLQGNSSRDLFSTPTGAYCVRYNSNVPGFTDVFVTFIFQGVFVPGALEGNIYHEFTNATYWTGNVRTTTENRYDTGSKRNYTYYAYAYNDGILAAGSLNVANYYAERWLGRPIKPVVTKDYTTGF